MLALTALLMTVETRMALTIDLTAAELRALAPFFKQLDPLHLRDVLEHERQIGRQDREMRRAGTWSPWRYTPADAEWSQVVTGLRLDAAARYRRDHPDCLTADADAYGSAYAASVEALRAMYLGKPEWADAALDQLDNLGTAHGGR